MAFLLDTFVYIFLYVPPKRDFQQDTVKMQLLFFKSHLDYKNQLSKFQSHKNRIKKIQFKMPQIDYLFKKNMCHFSNRGKYTSIYIMCKENPFHTSFRLDTEEQLAHQGQNYKICSTASKFDTCLSLKD